MKNEGITNIQKKDNSAMSLLNSLFNSSIIKTEEVNLEYIEGAVLSYNKAYKTLVNVTTTSSSHASSSWSSDKEVSLNTYVSTNVQSDNIPVIDFWLQYDNGTEEAHTVTQEIPMRPGHRLRLNYLTVDGSNFYMYDVENIDTGSVHVLISGNSLLL